MLAFAFLCEHAPAPPVLVIAGGLTRDGSERAQIERLLEDCGPESSRLDDDGVIAECGDQNERCRGVCSAQVRERFEPGDDGHVIVSDDHVDRTRLDVRDEHATNPFVELESIARLDHVESDVVKRGADQPANMRLVLRDESQLPARSGAILGCEHRNLEDERAMIAFTSEV
ncbi:MAG TPA: hypothetical protein VGG28_14370 [Kofleriaceae bacterium]